MTTVQINFKNAEQADKLLIFLKKLRVKFNITESEDYTAEIIADEDEHDAYKASMKVLSNDWDDPENDFWDTL